MTAAATVLPMPSEPEKCHADRHDAYVPVPVYTAEIVPDPAPVATAYHARPHASTRVPAAADTAVNVRLVSLSIVRVAELAAVSIEPSTTMTSPVAHVNDDATVTAAPVVFPVCGSEFVENATSVGAAINYPLERRDDANPWATVTAAATRRTGTTATAAGAGCGITASPTSSVVQCGTTGSAPSEPRLR